VSGEEKIIQHLGGLPGTQWTEVKDRIAKGLEHRKHALELIKSASHHDEQSLLGRCLAPATDRRIDKCRANI
jgi:hypothetical protein